VFDQVTSQIGAILLSALRLGPTLAFAPPFTLVKLPAPVRAVLLTALAAAMLPSLPPGAYPRSAAAAASAGIAELAVGIAMALPLQLAFALITMAGRALDIQAGFGLAYLIDPTTRAQTPLIGALFTYAAAAVFFTTGAPYELIAAFALSYRQVPVAAAGAPEAIGALLAFVGAVSVLALGLVGLAVTVLFIVDLVIAMLSRTLPQMNVLVLGFQVKAIVAILVLPATIGIAAAGIVRLIRLSAEAMLAVA
jgi:flagellar biosynthetic protein FliR